MMSKPDSFKTIFADWDLPSRGTTDVFSTLVDPSCYASAFGDTSFDLKKPRWGMGQKAPKTGNTMIGFFTYTPSSSNYREYVQVRLKQTLKKGERYYVECWVARANFTHFASNHIGIAFSQKPLKADHAKVLKINPLINETELIKTRFDEWHKIADTIILEKDADYLLIGNFFTDDQTEILALDKGLESEDANRNGAFYYLDDVGVWKVQEQYQTLFNEALKQENDEQKLELDSLKLEKKKKTRRKN